MEKIGNSKKKGVDEQLSVHFVAGEREGILYACGSKSLKASECCEESRRFVMTRVETFRPQFKTAWLRVQKPLAHSWQVRPLIHALFRKDSCLKGRGTAPSK